MWALALTLLECLTGARGYPYSNAQTTLFQVGRGVLPDIPQVLSLLALLVQQYRYSEDRRRNTCRNTYSNTQATVFQRWQVTAGASCVRRRRYSVYLLY